MARGERAPRKDLFMYAPERLVLVTDKEHPLYDPRVEDPVDESMTANIAMHGVLEPILVRRNGTDMEVVAGRGRTKAAIAANKRLTTEGKPPILVPVIIKGGSDADLFGILIAENEMRRDDSMIHKGEKARKLQNMGYTTQQIAITFGVTRQAVENWLEVQQMPEPIKQAVQSGDLSATAALQLAGLPRNEQVNRYQHIKQQGAKPTKRNVKSAVASTDSKPKPCMRSRLEIEQTMKKYANKVDEYTNGWCDALSWVLNGKEVKRNDE